MSIKKILGITGISIAVIIIILGGLLFRSCQLHTDSLYGVRVTGDGSGGATAVYEDTKTKSIYAQKISPDGNILWGERGILLGGNQEQSYSYSGLNIVSDGSDGAIVVWPPDPSKEQLRPASHLARLDAEGKILWQHDFIYFDKLISDGAGGAIIIFDYPRGGVSIPGDQNSDISLVKVDSQGNYSWGLQGVTVSRKNYWPNSLQIISDGAGGSIVIWEEMEFYIGTTPPNATHTCRIMIQRVDSTGKLAWGVNGAILSTNPEDTFIEEPRVTSDGSGEAIVAWHQHPAGRVEGGSSEWFTQDICVQRIDSSGNILWPTNGIPLGIVNVAEGASPHTPLLVSDSSGGAIIIWEDLRNGLASIYSQRVDLDGVMKWQAGGVQVCYVKSNASLSWRQIAGDMSGGAIVSYGFKEAGTSKKGILVQKLDSAGKTIWPDNGIVATGSDTSTHLLIPDGQGGAIVAWGVGKGIFNSEEAYIQRISADGKLMWEKGIKLNR